MRPPYRRALAALTVLTLAASFVPTVPAIASTAAPPASASRPAREAASAAPRGVIVQLDRPAPRLSALAALAGSDVDTRSAVTHADGRTVVRVRAGADAYAVARALAKRAGVRWAVPDVRMHAEALPVPPNDSHYSIQRPLLGPTSAYPYSIDLEPAWSQAFASADHEMDLSRQGVTLALVDTGYTPTAETSPGVFVNGYNFVAGNTDTADDDGHGTMVGNIMHARTGNAYGVAGVQYATPSKVLVYKVLDASGNGSMSDVISGVKAAADAGAKVINCSLGGSGYDANGQPIPGMQQAWDDTVSYVTARGAILVAAAGNENDAVDYPAAAKGAIAVGAIDPSTGTRSYFSNYGPQLAVVAPGQDVPVFGSDGTVDTGAGTSFSSPIVAGSVGMLWSLLPKLPAATITSAVLSTAHDLGGAGFDSYYGHGELDVWAAYRRLMETVPAQAPESLSVSGTPGFTTTLRWSPAGGSDVVYHYGLVGGPTYTTTGTSAEMYLGADGTYTAWVSASSSDMFSAAPATLGFTVATGRPALLMHRYAGADRYATAAAISRSEFPTGAPSVVIASGETFPDALSASVLAHRRGAPLLLTRATYLPQATADEVSRLKPSAIVIVGGTPSVSDAVRAKLASLAPGVTRIAGADRYATAEQVALAVRSLEGGSIPSSTVVVASGENYPDALAASPLAAAAGYPILLAKHDSIPAATMRALGELGATRTILAGGAPTVSGSAAASLPGVTRVAGADRYATSRLLADYAVSSGLLSRSRLGLATGTAFPDALAGGVLMARLDGPLVLAGKDESPLDAWLAGIGDACGEVEVFGSETAVPAPLAAGVLSALRGL